MSTKIHHPASETAEGGLCREHAEEAWEEAVRPRDARGPGPVPLAPTPPPDPRFRGGQSHFLRSPRGAPCFILYSEDAD